MARIKSLFLVVISSVLFMMLVFISRPLGLKGHRRKTKSFKLDLCHCTRTIPMIQPTSRSNMNMYQSTVAEDVKNNDYTIDPTVLRPEVEFNSTTCGRDAYQRGSHQKVLGFSFYGSSNSFSHKSKQYFHGIEENLEKMTELYGEDWVMRLYYDLEPTDQQLMSQLCDLACANNNLDLCNIRS